MKMTPYSLKLINGNRCFKNKMSLWEVLLLSLFCVACFHLFLDKNCAAKLPLLMCCISYYSHSTTLHVWVDQFQLSLADMLKSRKTFIRFVTTCLQMLICGKSIVQLSALGWHFQIYIWTTLFLKAWCSN